jgi:hypothetical protein
MKYKKYFNTFTNKLNKKMEKGYHEYGDKSFDREPKELMGEIEEELLDICGWSIILFARLQELKKKL